MQASSIVTPGLRGPAYWSALPARAAACLVCVLLALVLEAQAPKYGVVVEIDDKKADFASFKTYAWQRGQASFDKTIDAQIVAAVDAEFAKLGMTRGAPESVDVLVTYASTNRTDVDLKARPDAAGVRPNYAVGTLVVALLNPATRNRLLRMRVDQPIDAAPDKLEATIKSVVIQMFERYPTRQKR
jgi:Domain of unknown function (DUF4136)